MNFQNPSADANNTVLIARVRNSLAGMQANGNLTDANANKTIFFHIDFVFNVAASSASLSYDVRVWRLKVYAAVRQQVLEYYTPAARSQISASQYDAFPPSLETMGAVESVKLFASAVADEASALAMPNVNVIAFLARNAVLIALVLGVGYAAVAYRKPIAAALNLGK